MAIVYTILNLWDPRTFPKPTDEAILDAIEHTRGNHDEICEYLVSHYSVAFAGHITERLAKLREENKIRFLSNVPSFRFQPGTFGRVNRWVTQEQMRKAPI